MAMFSIDLSKAQNVNLTVNQIDEDQWIVDIGTVDSAAVFTLSTQQVVQLGLIDLSDDFIDYRTAAYDYLLGIVEQDEQNYVEYYSDVELNMKDLYGQDFDMEEFGSELDAATKDLKSYLRVKLIGCDLKNKL